MGSQSKSEYGKRHEIKDELSPIFSYETEHLISRMTNA